MKRNIMIQPELLHYLAAILPILLGALGAGIGLGIASLGVEEAMTRQPTGHAQSFRALIIGLALIESGAIVALVTSLLTLFSRNAHTTFPYAFAELGMSLAVGCSAAAICIASSFVVKAAAQAISRQPLFAPKTITFMLISQSIIEAPVIFAFITALLIRNQLTPNISLPEALRLFSSGLVIALGCIGPSIGQALFSSAACKSIGINTRIYNKIFPYALLNQAVIETPMIFCLLFSFLILFKPITGAALTILPIKYLIASCTMSIGALGPAIGIGVVASRSCYHIALEPSSYTVIARATLLAIAFIESSVVYALIIAMLLIIP